MFWKPAYLEEIYLFYQTDNEMLVREYQWQQTL